MKFTEAGLSREGEQVLLQTARNMEAVVLGTASAEIEVETEFYNMQGPKEEPFIRIPLGGDEDLHLETDLLLEDPDNPKLRYIMIGQIAARSIGPEPDVRFNQTEEELKELDDAFDDWIGDYGGYLGALVVVSAEKDARSEATAVVARIETDEEYSAAYDAPEPLIAAVRAELISNYQKMMAVREEVDAEFAARAVTQTA